MKTAIFLILCLTFVSCGRSKGPNTRPNKGNKSASSQKAGAGANNKNALACSEFSNDMTTQDHYENQMVAVGSFQYKLTSNN